MKLIEPLASGIAVAAVGTVILNRRGTATRASYYKDFEASQVYSTQPITLDSSGSVVLYVAQLVDVLVYDSSGALVREFVAGDNDASVEVISPSFTGTSYSDGSTGASKPTTLENVLDLWVGSAGTTDFKVIPSGTSTPVTIAVATAALSGLFFNVKSYGAIGNGVADDGSAVQAAMTAAAAANNGGGTVFFPPGTYRSTIGLTLSGGSKMLGAGAGTIAKLMFDAAAAGLTLTAGVNTQTVLDSMYISCQTTVNSATIITVSNPGRVHMQDCTIGGDTAVAGRSLEIFGGATAETTIHRCRFVSNSGTAVQYQILANPSSWIRLPDCDFINLQGRGIDHVVVGDGVSIRGCRFSADNASSLATHYVSYDGFGVGALSQASEVIGCFFSAVNAGVVPVCLYNSQAVPARDLIEYGNTFGSAARLTTGAIIPYGYATDGYASISVDTCGYHGSRSQNREIVGGSPASCKPKANSESIINWAGGAAVTLQTDKGSIGDVWVLYVINTTVGALTVTPSAQMILDAAAGTFTVANNGTKKLTFAWLPTLAGTGFWQQCAPSATS